MSNWCLSIFMTGLNHWIILSQKETYDRLHFEKFLYKNFLSRTRFFRNHHSWWIYFRNHTQTSVCEIFFQRLCIFENFIFEITFFEYYFEKHSFKYVCENKFVENSFRNHENFRNLIFWMISKILHMSMFSINTLSRTHLVIFF